MSDIFGPLKKEIKTGEVLVPGTEGYEVSLKSWSTTRAKNVVVVIKPTNAEEVSTTVRFAREHSLPFTVCGNGYSTASLFSTKDSMLIDLSRMRNVTVDPARQTVTYGGGCTWADVDKALWAYGLATPGGMINQTCVSDMILGGGFGMLSGRHGLSTDCLQSAQMVLADGRVVTANETENADLFWAARGAVAGFGVATEFTSRAFPQDGVWAGRLAYPLDRIPDLVTFANEFPAKTDGDQYMALTLGFGPPPARAPLAIVLVFYNGPTADAENFFAPILSLDNGPLFNTATAMPYPRVNTLRINASGYGQRWLLDRIDFDSPIDARVVQNVAKMFFDYSTSHGGMRYSNVSFELVSSKKVRSVPVDTMAFRKRDDCVNAAIAINWTDESQDNDVRHFSHRLLAEIRGEGRKQQYLGT